MHILDNTGNIRDRILNNIFSASNWLTFEVDQSRRLHSTDEPCKIMIANYTLILPEIVADVRVSFI